MSLELSEIFVKLHLVCSENIEDINLKYLPLTSNLANCCNKILKDLTEFNFYKLPKRFSKLILIVNNLENFVFDLIVDHPSAHVQWAVSGNRYDTDVLFVTHPINIQSYPPWILTDDSFFQDFQQTFKMLHEIIKTICESCQFSIFWRKVARLKQQTYWLKYFYMESHNLLAVNTED